MRIIIAADEFVRLYRVWEAVAGLLGLANERMEKTLRFNNTFTKVQELFCSLVAADLDPETALNLTEEFFLEGRAVFELPGEEKEIVVKPIGGFQTTMTFIELLGEEEKEGKAETFHKLMRIAYALLTEKKEEETS